MFIFYFLVFVRWDDLERVRLVFREVEVLLVMPHRAAVMAAAAAEDMPVNMPVNLEPRLKGLCPNGLCWRKVSSNSLERLKVHWLMPWLVFIYCSAHHLAHIVEYYGTLYHVEMFSFKDFIKKISNLYWYLFLKYCWFDTLGGLTSFFYSYFQWKWF